MVLLQKQLLDLHRHRLIQLALHPDEHVADFGDVANGGLGIGHRAKLQFQEVREFLGVELIGARADVLIQDEVQKLLLGWAIGC